MSETDTLLERIKQADPQLASLATDDNANLEASETNVAWWPALRVVDVTVNLPHKPLRFRYALSDSRLIKLGLAAGVQQANTSSHMQLEHGQLGAYLRFYIASSELRSLQVVESADEPPWLGDADEDAGDGRAKAGRASPHPPNSHNGTGRRVPRRRHGAGQPRPD